MDIDSERAVLHSGARRERGRFVGTLGTDPELLLLSECRKGENGPRWFYVPIRSIYRELWLLTTTMKKCGTSEWMQATTASVPT